MRADWAWASAEGVGFWRVAALERRGALAIFSSRVGGASVGPYAALNLGTSVGDDPGLVAANRTRFARAAGFDPAAVAAVNQVHGGEVRVAAVPGEHGPADALITASADVRLCIGVADCAAVFLLDPVRGAVGLCHAGWRGTAADVAGAAVRAMVGEFGTRPDDLWAAVSPAIGACCYEVDGPVIEALRLTAPWADQVLRFGGASPAGHAHLDLEAANVRRLRDAGVRPEAVAAAGICTACRTDLLFSHRRDRGRTGRMRAVLGLAAPIH